MNIEAMAAGNFRVPASVMLLHWPRIQTARAKIRRTVKSIITALAPDCTLSTQASQTTVPRSKNPMNCLSVTIHWPGLGRNFKSSGKAERIIYGKAIPSLVSVPAQYR